MSSEVCNVFRGLQRLQRSATSSEVCARHKFELEGIPEARRAGWDSPVDWSSLEARVKKLQPVLEDILLDEEGLRPRAQSPFWKSLTGRSDGSLSRTQGTANHLSDFKLFEIG